MSARLIIVHDAFGGERSEHALVPGAKLSDELMRVFTAPPGGWRLYRQIVNAEHEIAALDAEHVTITPDCLIFVVCTPGTPDIWVQLGVALILSLIANVFAPTPQRARRPQSISEQQETGTNQLAGQSNVLRPGARVPDILGRMRVYPDMITYPIERWTEGVNQNIEQFFAVGVGSYELADHKLGETPLASIIGSALQIFQPGTNVAPINAIKVSTTVDTIALNIQENTTPPVAGVSFNGAANTMSAPSALALDSNAPVSINGTLDNNGPDFIVSGPTGSGPYVYQLAGPVVNESGATPSFEAWTRIHAGSHQMVYGDDGSPDTNAIFVGVSVPSVKPGCMIVWLDPIDGLTYYGIADDATDYGAVGAFMNLQNVRDLAGNLYQWVGRPVVDAVIPLTLYNPPTSIVVPPGGGEDDDPDPTNWHAVPMQSPDEVWIDISFPNGLAKYVSGARESYAVQVRADFHRAGMGADVVQDTRTFTMRGARTRYLRWTHRVPVASLALPGSGGIEVRLKRLTPIETDSATTQYVADTRWQQLRAMKLLPERLYPDVTIVRLGLTNSASAMSLGEQTYNTVATRRVPVWDGSSWSDLTATAQWAWNFAARCKAPDGAALSDAQIDLAGLLTLQTQLNALDGGDQGTIALALDQPQDVDAELAQIADLVRAVVYRVGRKVYVSRDQANATPIALFNGRTKAVEGESISVRLKSDDDNDAVQVQWLDEASGWKVRDLIYNDTYPAPIAATNVLRIGPICCNWAQAYRRAVYEWARVKFRREAISVQVTEDGRICRPGDVVHVTDDIANLAIAAGEVLLVEGMELVLDRDLIFSGGPYSMLLRDVEGTRVDVIACVAGSAENRVLLSRAPAGITVKGRTESLGTLYAFYSDANVTVRQWLLGSVAASGDSVTLSGVNYTQRVYEGDAAILPERPPPLDGVPGDSAPLEPFTFAATAHTLTSPSALGLVLGAPIRISNTALNNGDYFVSAVPPPEQVTPPYVYTLEGSVADETVTPTITRYTEFGGANSIFVEAYGTFLTTGGQIMFGPPELYNPSPGVLTFVCMAQVNHAGTLYRGIMTEVWYRYDEPTTNVTATDMTIPMTIYDAVAMNFPNWVSEMVDLTLWRLPAGL